jgi:hypothetical protein
MSLPFTFIVFGVLHDVQDENLLRPVVHSPDQPILIAINVKDGSAVNLIGASEIGAQFRKRLPHCLARDGEPGR